MGGIIIIMGTHHCENCMDIMDQTLQVHFGYYIVRAAISVWDLDVLVVI